MTQSVQTIALGAAVGAALALGLAAARAETPENPDVAQAKVLIKEFATTLQGELKAGMKAGGPTKAIAVCKERAPAIASDLSARSGWEVGRTSLKTRNTTLNAPDDWEREVMQRFAERKAAGESVDALAFAEVTGEGEKKQFRFMKAIPTGEVCLACHGDAITPEVKAALDADYPGDQARDYVPGDIRGAFTLSKPL